MLITLPSILDLKLKVPLIFLIKSKFLALSENRVFCIAGNSFSIFKTEGSKFKLEYDKADESGKRQIRQGIEEQLQGLTKLFELRKMNSDEINIIHGPIKGTSNATREGIETLTEKYTKFKGELPKEWEGKMFPQVKASYWERKLNSSIVDQRAFGLITMGVEAGIFRVENIFARDVIGALSVIGIGAGACH